MEVKQLTQRQLFTMKRKGLETKVKKFWEATRNADLVVEYIVAIILRNALVVSDFSLPCQEVVRELLFQAEPSDTLRKFCPFLKDYVEDHEWHSGIKRLFKNETAYFKATKTMRLYESYLKNKGKAINAKKYDSYTLISIFEDANGKKHTWRLRDGDSSNTPEETKRILRILTTMTIFRNTADVRRFAKFIDCDLKGTTTIFSTRTEKKQEREKSAQNLTVETEKTSADSNAPIHLFEGFDLYSLTKGELVVLIEGILNEAKAAIGMEDVIDERTENSEELSSEKRTPHKPNIDTRIVPESIPKKDTAPSEENPILMPAAVGVLDAPTENPVKTKLSATKPPTKKISKKDRNILKNYNSSKKRH